MDEILNKLKELTELMKEEKEERKKMREEWEKRWDTLEANLDKKFESEAKKKSAWNRNKLKRHVGNQRQDQ